jgi:hypothetical protein
MAQTRRTRWGPAWFLFFAVLASCDNPPDSGTNNPPEVTFYDLQATGAGSPEVNGYYRENGFNQGRPKYDHVDGGCFLYYLLASDQGDNPYWVIKTVVDDKVLDALYYNGDATSVTAPVTPWSPDDPPTNPAPVVSREAITGTLSVGQTLTGNYLFTDPDGDDEGGTTFQWYRFTTVTETDTANGTAIVGATGSTYQLQAADASNYLRLQVTPMDARGLAGTPVLSGAVNP